MSSQFFLYSPYDRKYVLLTQDQLNRVELSDDENMILKFPKRLLIEWLRFNTNAHINIEKDNETKELKNSFLIMKNNRNPYPGFINPFSIAWIFHEKGILNHFQAIKAQMHDFVSTTKKFSQTMTFESQNLGSDRYLHINNQSDPDTLKWNELEWISF